MADSTRFGTVAVVGRPNVGKSTLVNRLVGEHLCITADRPQTTRHRVMGVVTRGPLQVALVDTPGIHGHQRRRLNRVLNRNAGAALTGVDVALFVVAALRWTDDDALVRDRLREARVPVLGVVNRIDQVRDKAALLPFLEDFSHKLDMVAIVPVSARTGEQLDALWRELEPLIPEGPHAFDADMLTDRSERFLAAELIREQLVRHLGDEVPHALTVEIDRFQEDAQHDRLVIGATIWVERPGQKAIVIGAGGARLKQVGTRARERMTGLFGRHVHLDLWVKVRAGWPDDPRMLRQLGYDGE